MDMTFPGFKTKEDSFVVDGDRTSFVSFHPYTVKCSSGSYPDATLQQEEYSSATWQDETLTNEAIVGGGRWTCTRRIRYESKPQVNGALQWNRCIHSTWGFDPQKCVDSNPFRISGTHNPSFLEVGRKVTDVQWYPPGRRNIFRHNVCTSTMKAPLITSSNAVYFPPLSQVKGAPGPRNIDEVEATSIDRLITDYYPEYATEYSDFRATYLHKFRHSTDLNELLRTESLFYSNILQLVPFGRILAQGKKVQRAALWLNALKSRFGKRPFWEAIRTAVHLDLVNRFVVQTTIADMQDFMSSFDEVWRLFAEGQARNGLDWTRLATRSPSFDMYNVIREDRVRLHVPGHRTLPGSGIDGSHCTLKALYGLSDGSFTAWTTLKDGQIGNDESEAVGARTVNEALDEALRAGFGGQTPIVELARGAQCRVDFFRWVKVRYKNLGALSPLKVWANRVGITKPLSSLWDLIPFSFVCDYFFRIGDWIAAIDHDLASFKELRGDIIASQDPWTAEKWSVGARVRLKNYERDAAAQRAVELGLDSSSLELPPVSWRIPVSSRYSRFPLSSMVESSRLGFVSDKALSSTQKRTLAELAFSQMDKKLRAADRLDNQAKSAVKLLKIQSRVWRTPNPVIDGMSVDQFSDYVKRTLKQAATTVKVNARTRK